MLSNSELATHQLYSGSVSHVLRLQCLLDPPPKSSDQRTEMVIIEEEINSLWCTSLEKASASRSQALMYRLYNVVVFLQINRTRSNEKCDVYKSTVLSVVPGMHFRSSTRNLRL